MGSCIPPQGTAPGHPSPNALLCPPALQGPHLQKEQEPAGAPLEGMRRLGAAARLPPANVTVPEHPQVRAGERRREGRAGVGWGWRVTARKEKPWRVSWGSALPRCLPGTSSHRCFVRWGVVLSPVCVGLSQAP